jgi:hypothetical protein
MDACSDIHVDHIPYQDSASNVKLWVAWNHDHEFGLECIHQVRDYPERLSMHLLCRKVKQ